MCQPMPAVSQAALRLRVQVPEDAGIHLKPLTPWKNWHLSHINGFGEHVEAQSLRQRLQAQMTR